jgi:hypothetical protein
MSSVQRNTIHYDRPIAHTKKQTRWLIPRGSKVSSVTMKLLDIKLNPNKECYFAALVGVYGCVQRLQLRVNKQEIDYYFSPEVLPYILASSADNEGQKGVFSVLHNTGNNIAYDPTTKELTLERNVVDSKTCEIRLNLLSNWLQTVGVIDDEVEIIIDWNQDVKKYLLPKAPLDVVTDFNIEAPYLSYETLEGTNLKQPEQFVFTELVPDQWVIPAIVGNGKTTSTTVRSNAFNEKTINRILLANVPQSIQNKTPGKDATALYRLFGSYLSVPQVGEVFQVGIDGEAILTIRNVQNDAVKLSMAIDSFGVYPHAVSLGHLHTKTPVLQELVANVVGEAVPQLNGFFSYGVVDLYQRINKELQFVYQRTSVNSSYPTLQEQMIIYAIGEVRCAFVKGQKVYV